MNASLKRLVLWTAGLLTIAFLFILLNQVLQLSDAAARVHPRLGQGVFGAGMGILVLCLLVPAVAWVRFPRRLAPPSEGTGPEFDRYVAGLSERLSRNPLLRGRSVRELPEVEEALQVLDAHADEVIRKAGSRAFVTTAISQNGALDALVVLGIQARLVWDLARIYQQRPGPVDMLDLYGNDVATAFVAGQLEEADVSEVLQPVMSTALGSAAALIPGLQVASGVFVNSVLSGTANAFLTLRVGIITQEYKRSLVRPSRSALRRSAFSRAAGMLSSIAVAGAADVAAAIGRAWGQTITGGLKSGGQAVTSAMRASGDALTGAARASGDAITEAARASKDAVTGAAGGVGKWIGSAGDAARRRVSGRRRGDVGGGAQTEPGGN